MTLKLRWLWMKCLPSLLCASQLEMLTRSNAGTNIRGRVKKTHSSIICLQPNQDSRHINLWLTTPIPNNCNRKIIENPANKGQNKESKWANDNLANTCIKLLHSNECVQYTYKQKTFQTQSHISSSVSKTFTKYSHVNLIFIIDFLLETFGRSFIQLDSAYNFAKFCFSHLKLKHTTQKISDHKIAKSASSSSYK